MNVSGVEWSTDDVVRHLRSSPVFAHLPDAALAEVAGCATVALVTAGDDVMEEGAHGADAFVVIAGRLDVIIGAAHGDPSVVSALGPGDVVGEMALITDEPRSATVRARRESALMRIAAEDFRSIVLDHPEALLAMTRTVMGRLRRSIHNEQPDVSQSVIAVLPAGTRPAHYDFAADFTDVLTAEGLVPEVVSAERVRRDLGADATSARVAEYLHRIEDGNDIVVLVGEAGNPAWTDLCRRHSDVALLVGQAESLGDTGDYELGDPEDDASIQLVLVHTADRPTGTADILSLRPHDRYHHVRKGRKDDIGRVARIVRGVSTGVVLGGGGARGFAHIGVLRALVEAGIRFDHIGGSSIGSAVASAFAMGNDLDEVTSLMEWVTHGQGGVMDSTFPSVSIARGRRLSSAMREAYGDRDIRDLWVEFYGVSSDLTDGTLHVHRSGPVWEAVRASVAIPGIFPPMRSRLGHVLVDGGVLDNVPTATMQSEFGPARTIAVDLRAASPLASADLPDDGGLSGWRVLRNRIIPWRERLQVPGIVETLVAASTITGGAADIDADLVIRPPVDEFAFLDFSASHQIVEAGYRHTVDLLERRAATGSARS